jgi:hypothetical protein
MPNKTHLASPRYKNTEFFSNLLGFETGESLRARLDRRWIITDDNMGAEWRSSQIVVSWGH